MWVQLRRMSGHIFTVVWRALLSATLLLSNSASARAAEPSEHTMCHHPKHRHAALRALTEPTLVWKKDKVRVRRILM